MSFQTTFTKESISLASSLSLLAKNLSAIRSLKTGLCMSVKSQGIFVIPITGNPENHFEMKLMLNVISIFFEYHLPGLRLSRRSEGSHLIFLCRHFQTTDQKKFQDIWSMNEEQVRELVHSVMEEDRIIHEHQLGLPWEPPDL